MFVHAAFRPLWPVIFFLPWLFLGIAYLIEWLRRSRMGPRASAPRPEPGANASSAQSFLTTTRPELSTKMW
jgi:hypothetical protein